MILREGWKKVVSLPEGEQTVGMVMYHDILHVATTRHVYVMHTDGVLYPIEFCIPPEIPE